MAGRKKWCMLLLHCSAIPDRNSRHAPNPLLAPVAPFNIYLLKTIIPYSRDTVAPASQLAVLIKMASRKGPRMLPIGRIIASSVHCKAFWGPFGCFTPNIEKNQQQQLGLRLRFESEARQTRPPLYIEATLEPQSSTHNIQPKYFSSNKR